MFLRRAKKNAEGQDQAEIRQKHESYMAKFRLSTISYDDPVINAASKAENEETRSPKVLDNTDGPGMSTMQIPKLSDLELPDGSHISPLKLQRTDSQDAKATSVRDAEYIGSFSVIGEDQEARAEYVKKQLAEMQTVNKSKPVLLVISLSGIKVCSSSGESVYMAHALKRISYATCDPEFCQFSFLAREPKGSTSIQYCHAFMTKTSQEAEELNMIVANAFKLAYAQQKQESTNGPSFNDMIEQQIEENKQKFEAHTLKQQELLQNRLSYISTPSVDEKLQERKERRKKEMEEMEKQREEARLQGKDRLAWAKHIVPKTRHKVPYMDDGSNSQQGTSGQSNNANSNSNQSPSAAKLKSLNQFLDNKEKVRNYGSPVMTLKETIDTHYYDFKRNNKDVDLTDNSTLYTNSDTNQFKMSSPEQENNQQSSDFQNRPLPVTPNTATIDGVQRRQKNHKSSPKSQIASKHLSAPPTDNGYELNNKRYSVRYQNASPIHYRSDSGASSNSFEENDVYQGPSTPKRYDSAKPEQNYEQPVDEDLRNVSWFQAGIPREIALDLLSQQDIGSFIMRDSTSHPGCFALSVKVPKFDNPTGISHYLIMRAPRGGYKLKGLDKEWPTLTALVTHHTVMREMLPVTLTLPRTANNPVYRETDNCQDKDDDYQRLSDCSAMMRDLKM